ncbi:hypothetical protein [Blastococcus sp. TF02A-35]|uniref:hypothetical protein n=1 Tax=Blastococcus sp. TF02A-35 TaxID=2559612 RepID=UPI0010742CBB|nr:hypothetical protein [Blastococcus sp. TF02A_35]
MTTSAFVGDPQPVEIHHRGIWYSGELLGWRHTPDGLVSARVRCTVDGLRHSTWKDLSELRLPDPAHPPRREPYPAAPARALAGAPVEDDDRTRPNNHFTGLSARPGKPAHVLAPPAAPRPVASPVPAPAAPPAARTSTPAAPARPRPTPYRRTPVDQADAWSRGWTAEHSWDEHDERLSTV